MTAAASTLRRSSRSVALALLAAAVLAAAPAGRAQQADETGQMGGVGLTVFADAEYHGRNATFRHDTPDLKPYGMDDRITSLRVAPGEVWEVCELANYEGRCQVFAGAQPSLRSSGWSDIISSVRRIRGPGMPAAPAEPAPAADVRLELFAKPRFQGDRHVLTSEIPDLGRIGFNDKAASLRPGNGQAWEVCVDTNYRGCRLVDAAWPELKALGVDRRISSVRPVVRDGSAAAAPIGRIVLFDDRDFKGRTLMVDGTWPTLGGFQDKAESVQVSGGGLWELCERPNFAGRCAIVSTNVSDLGALGLRNRVNSVRPRTKLY